MIKQAGKEWCFCFGKQEQLRTHFQSREHQCHSEVRAATLSKYFATSFIITAVPFFIYLIIYFLKLLVYTRRLMMISTFRGAAECVYEENFYMCVCFFFFFFFLGIACDEILELC